MSGSRIDRGFIRLVHGLIHYREAAGPERDAKTPLVLAHGGPGSSAGLAPLISALGVDRRVVAPDMMGNGESDPPPLAETSIAFYAECLIAAMDRLGLDHVDLYGHHTGAQVITELAIARPERVRRLVLDGLGLFPDEQRAEFLRLYAPPLAADPSGAHVVGVWDFINQATQHFPHYLRDDVHRIAEGAAPPADVATDRAAEVLKVWRTYHLSYGAAFRHRFAERLPELSAPTLILAIDRDPLSPYAEVGAGLVPAARIIKTSHAGRAEAIRDFLDETADQSVTNTRARAATS